MCLHFGINAFGQEHARVIESKTTYHFNTHKSVDVEEYLKLKILSDKGYDHSIVTEYTDKFRKIESISIELFDAHDIKVKRLKKSDGVEIGLSPSYEISDTKMLIIDPKYKEYPFTIEIVKRVHLEGFISLPTWVPQDQFNIRVDHAQLQLNYPDNLKFNFREEFITNEMISQTNNQSNIKRIYKVENLPSVDNKMRYQDFYKSRPKVYISPEKFWLNDQIGSMSSWTSFGNWYSNLNDIPYSLTNETKTYIDGLDKSNSEALIQRLYEYMQDKTRYVSIQLGIGGFKSLPTEDVEKYGYGDCKALSTYMKNLLEYAGITSNYILTRAGLDVPDVIADFPSNQFNHVFVGVPNKTDTIYLECTSQESPYNYTGTFTDDRNVLWIDKDRSQILRSKTYSHKVNIQNNTVTVELSQNGDALINYETTNKGLFFDEVMIFQSAPADYISNHNRDKFNYNDFAIKDFKFKQYSRSIPEFSSSYTLRVNGLAQNTGDRLVLGSTITTPLNKYIVMDDLQKYCSIKRGISVIDEVKVNLRSNFWIYQLQDPVTINSKFGNYYLEMSIEENRLVIKRSFVLLKGDYTNSDFEEFQKFYKQLEKIENRKIVLNSKT